MKTFQEFLEQSGSPSMFAKQQVQSQLSLARAKQRINFGFSERRRKMRDLGSQARERHSDLERQHALP